MRPNRSRLLATATLAWIAGAWIAGGSLDPALAQRIERGLQPATPEFQQPATRTLPVPGPQQNFEIELGLPLLWTSNAVQEFGAQNAVGPPESDFHVIPEITARWRHQFAFVRLSALVDTSGDLYFRKSDASQDVAYGVFKAEFTNGQSDLFVPYVAYSPEVDFIPFARWQDTLNYLFAGFSSAIGFDGSGRRIPFRDAIDPGDLSFAFDFNLGRRFAAPGDLLDNFVSTSMDIIYVLTPELSVWLTPLFRAKYYPNYFGEVRRDYRLGTDLLLQWTPDWLTRHIRRAELDFTVSFTRNNSNISEQTYSAWDIGPALLLRWRF